MKDLIRLALAVSILAAPALAQTQQSYDLIIRDGRLIDGSGNPWRRADVAVSNGRIAAVGRLQSASAPIEIDARGLYVAPGFIDVHSHAARGLASSELSQGRPLLSQGITSVVLNPDGGGPVDLAAQGQRLLEHGLGVNVALMVPHGSVRRQVMGAEDRAASPAELEQMKQLVRLGMEAGALGLSSGLYYVPGSFASTEEVVELAKVVAPFGGLHASHIRDEADYSVGLVGAVDEIIRISREAGIPGVVTHIKALGPRVWGFSQALIERIERARGQGLEIWADQYPYTASRTSLSGALAPRWALDGGWQRFMERLHDADQLKRLRLEIAENIDRRGGPASLQLGSHPRRPEVLGRTLGEFAREKGIDPTDAAIELLKQGDAPLISHNMHFRDVKRLMSQPWMMTCTDGGLVALGQGLPHPRSYGAFPRKIRKYVREESVIDLAFAIRSMTSLPADVFGLAGRGRISPGAAADVVIFELDRVRDPADYLNPHQLSQGMVWVLVNGVPAITQGRFGDSLAGRWLKRQP